VTPVLKTVLLVMPGAVVGGKVAAVAAGTWAWTAAGALLGGSAGAFIAATGDEQATDTLADAALFSTIVGLPCAAIGLAADGWEGARVGTGVGLCLAALLVMARIEPPRLPWSATA